MKTITRDQILNKMEEIVDDLDFQTQKQELLTKYVNELDLEAVEALLEVGANPNICIYRQFETRNHGFLHDLVHEFYNQNTLKADQILEMAKLLLDHGADPNQPGDCNAAPIQRCDSKISEPFKQLLLKYGARPEGNIKY